MNKISYLDIHARYLDIWLSRGRVWNRAASRAQSKNQWCNNGKLCLELGDASGENVHLANIS